VSLPRTRPPYPEEFRREAVRLLRSGERKVAVLARELGVSEQTLRNWRKQLAVDEGREHGLSSDERDELRRLRRENRILREEREVLRKAAAFFAKESDSR
jgi:transposase